VADSVPTDSLVREALSLAKLELERIGLPGKDLRERPTVDGAIKRAFKELTRVTVFGKGLKTEHFTGIGPVDVCVTDPPILIEVKWSYNETRSKIFESLWDAIKIALLCAESPAQLHPEFKQTPCRGSAEVRVSHAS
jgi:hypothetical protein